MAYCHYFYFTSTITIVVNISQGEVQSTSTLNNWAKYINKIKTRPNLITVITIKYLPNRLTPLYSKIYYKEENYLKVKTAVFKYINSFIVKVGI